MRHVTHVFGMPLLALTVLPMTAGTAIAQTVPAPEWKAGDRWSYQATRNPADTCSRSLTSGTVATLEVLATDANGYTLRRDFNGNSSEEKWGSDLTRTSKVGFTDGGKEDGFGFPMVTGKTWPSSWVRILGSSGTVKTELTCEAFPTEKLTVPAGEFEVVPIVCNGAWTNVSYRSGDQATAKYWYSPAQRNHVKYSLQSMWNGNTCVDVTWSLIKTP